ncbi:hypothetical protein [Paenibacillus polymyxa]|uniref:hypothetical protein n=1 Tax=Paenibacillus polymyxa TaxID=1406 RepID=UPI00287FB9E4|nr:hypothetical protein [Paenibacillus polymyxa]
MRVSDAINKLIEYYGYYGDTDLELSNIDGGNELKIIGFNPYKDVLVLEYKEVEEE